MAVPEAHGDFGGTLHDMPVREDAPATIDLIARAGRRRLFATFSLDILARGLCRGHTGCVDEHATRRVAFVDLARGKPIFVFKRDGGRHPAFLYCDCRR